LLLFLLKIEVIIIKEMQAMGLRPLHDRLIVERLEEDDVTKGGIFIPDAAKEKQQRGKVVAVGKGKLQDDGSLRALDVKAGDVVLFGKYSGTEVKIDNEERLIIREDDVLAVVE
jgi:chaperonin GroES